MGRYRSDDSDDEHSRKSKKRKKRRSRSSSSSSSQLSHISDSRSKKSRKKHRRSSRSRSRSRNRKYVSRSSKKSRSTSRDRYSRSKPRSDSTSPGRKSSKRRRSRSKSPSSRKRRSYSRSQKSRSASRDRRKKSYSRERSQSADRASSTRSSVDRRRVTGQPAGSPRLKGQPFSDTVSGFIDLTLTEQAEERLRQAMKAATSADEKLQARSAGESLGSSLYQDTKSFAASVSAIESDSFVASSFKSSRSMKIKEEAPESGMSHDDAIFGSLAISGFTLMPDPDTKPIQLDPDSIMHPSLYCDPQEKMQRWISRLVQLRRRKLEGDVI